MRALTGWFVWCCHDFREPEGVIFLDAAPQVGGLVKLSCGNNWRIRDINNQDMKIDVVPVKPEASS